MREIRIVLPVNAGETTHKWLSSRLVSDFGGFSRLNVSGCWQSGDGELISEDGAAYDVAVPDEPRSDWVLASIIAGLFERTKEQAIYARGRDGTVEVFERPKAGRRKAA